MRSSSGAVTPAGRVHSSAAPAARQSTATALNGTATGSDAAEARPVARLQKTPRLEKLPGAGVMTGRPAFFSARPAPAFIATSAAPLVAPTAASPTLRAGRFTAVNA